MSKPIKFRMDFVQKIISVDTNTGKYVATIEPDPRRYEWKIAKGKKLSHDKFDNVYFPENVLDQITKQSVGRPIYFQPQLIDDAESYIKSRKPVIEKMLDGGVPSPTFKDKSEDFLQSLSTDKLGFVIMSLDIVGSTKLATAMNPKKYARLISVILFELSEVVPKFHGHVLKYTGDGIIAYFPEPSFITKNDLALDCALTLRALVHKTLDPILKEREYPTINLRIGLDAGEAYIETIGSPETKQHKDIIGSVVSLAAKIQASGQPGNICLGATVFRNLHTMWRQICEPATLNNWNYTDSNGSVYKVYRVKTT